MNNFITYEQAVKFNSVENIAIEYEERLQDVYMLFAKNTVMQFTSMDEWFKIMELLQVYQDKDYSNYLFSETEKVFDWVEANKDKFETLKEQLAKIAQIVSSKISSRDYDEYKD